MGNPLVEAPLPMAGGSSKSHEYVNGGEPPLTLPTKVTDNGATPTPGAAVPSQR